MQRRMRYIVGVLFAVAFGLWLLLPRPSLLDDVPFSTSVYDRDGRLLRLTLAADDIYRLRMPLGRVAPVMQQATLVYEDQYFYRHSGINPVALGRAFWATYVEGGRRIGASTITMQLARLRYHMDSSTLGGKLWQIVRALQLELFYSKTEILEAYLNLAPYGHNIEGVAAASLVYFNKRPEQLNMLEALTLAVIPQNPGARVPTSAAGYARMAAARQILFDRWVETFPQDARQASLLTLPTRIRTIGELPFQAPHFTTEMLQQNPGVSEIETTLDGPMQRLLEQQIQAYVQRRRSVGIQNAAALLVDWRSMEVAGYVGSADFFNDRISGQVNGITARRSPGSAMKPFIYALAMQQGLIHPMSLLKDTPSRFDLYTPENFDRVFLGPVFAKDALIYSRNVPAVSLLQQLEDDSFYKLLQVGGVQGLQPPEHYGLALALGSFEVSMEEMARLYAMLRNMGELQSLQYVRGDEDVKLDQNTNKNQTKSAHPLTPEAAFLTLQMLGENPPVGRLASYVQVEEGAPVYWKTGTSFAFRDAWTVGVVGPYVLVVWVGNFDGSSNPSFVGIQAAAPLFFDLIESLEKNGADLDRVPLYPGRLNVRQVEVCAPTGDLPGKFCPRTTRSWFIPGVSPIKVSDVHRQIAIDRQTGLRACNRDPATTELQVFEVWPSDIQALFRQAGLIKRQPPAWHPDCLNGDLPVLGQPPRIVLPTANRIYSIRPGRSGRSDKGEESPTIPFKAVTEADAGHLYWFVNNRYVGTTTGPAPHLWPATPGHFTVRAVDDAGRAAVVEFTVVEEHS